MLIDYAPPEASPRIAMAARPQHSEVRQRQCIHTLGQLIAPEFFIVNREGITWTVQHAHTFKVATFVGRIDGGWWVTVTGEYYDYRFDSLVAAESFAAARLRVARPSKTMGPEGW